ncbi:MAG: adenine phosphoribosyltransferase [Bdellovibrionales bacterium]|nr:adenine phosphoribosyltransferase [Bdellovibrionales bacterium]
MSVNTSFLSELKAAIREVPDFPKPGINFFDITTVLQRGDLFHGLNQHLSEHYRAMNIDAVVGIESRGFIFASALADRLHCGFVPIRKPKKLPWKTFSVSYQLEYGADTIEIHQDALTKGQRILLVDDLLATGGTMAAALELVRKFEVEIVDLVFLIELGFLGGREKLPNVSINSLLTY